MTTADEWDGEIERVAVYLYRDEHDWAEPTPWGELPATTRERYLRRARTVASMCNFPHHTKVVAAWYRLCPCDHNPDTTQGPEQECPIHGDRPYAVGLIVEALQEARRPRAAAMLAELHDALGQPFGRAELGNAAGRRKLHVDEHRELLEAIDAGDRTAIAHELADGVYVAYGTAHTLGIPLDAVLDAVHRANMSKLGAQGPVLDADGKLRKAEGYVPADVAAVMARHEAWLDDWMSAPDPEG